MEINRFTQDEQQICTYFKSNGEINRIKLFFELYNI